MLMQRPHVFELCTVMSMQPPIFYTHFVQHFVVEVSGSLCQLSGRVTTRTSCQFIAWPRRKQPFALTHLQTL